MLKIKDMRVRFLSAEEDERLLAAMPLQLKQLSIVALNTGFRQSALLSLLWRHVDFENKVIRLPSELSKNSEPVNIPMNQICYSTL